MGQNITKIKSRIKSVTGAYKVTSAMKLVSTVKLQANKNKMLSYREYLNALESTCNEIFRFAGKVKSPLLNINEKAAKDLYVIVSSSLGLCGAYNTNIFKAVDANIKENDDAIILGNKGIIHYANKDFNKIDTFSSYSSIKDEKIVKEITSFLIDQYVKGNYKNIYLIYSSFNNPIVFIPKMYRFLPLNISFGEDNEVGYGPLLEPSPQKLFDSVAPMYLNTAIYSRLLESEVCEHAARSNAMENATDNAEELLDKLQIEFNKARQAAITQEIIEIVGASEAL